MGHSVLSLVGTHGIKIPVTHDHSPTVVHSPPKNHHLAFLDLLLQDDWSSLMWKEEAKESKPDLGVQKMSIKM